MTNSILDVLSCMFDYIFEAAKKDSPREIDDNELKAHLSTAGFDINRIDKALSLLENVTDVKDTKSKRIKLSFAGSMRIYSLAEKLKLSVESRNFLLFMKNIGQLSSRQHEIIINQVMSLNNEVCTDDVKWITMMVISNTFDKSSSLQWLESVIFLDDSQTLQ